MLALHESIFRLLFQTIKLAFPGGRRKDDSMGKTIVVCSNDDCVYRGDNGECGKDIIYLDDLGTCEDSE